MLGNDQKPIVFVVSDSIGETAELVVRAAASQFNSGRVEVRRISYVTDAESVREAVQAARGRRSIIVYTLILPQMRALIRELASSLGIRTVDIMGPTMDALSEILDTPPRLEPGLIHRLDEEYFRRVEAVEFAVKHDDGKEPSGIARADIVLTGVSRTSKTPVSMYLAHRRYRVANVPLVPELEPPRELYQVRADRVMGLTITPDKLYQIRQERLRTLGLPDGSDYGDMARIVRELAHAREVFRDLGCRVVDVSNRAVEETANEVLHILKGGETKGGRQ